MQLFDDLNDSASSLYVFICVITLMIVYRWYKRPYKFPPGPRGIPILGVIPFLKKYPEKVFKKWSSKYGPILSVRLGSQEVVVLNDYESLQQALVKQGPLFSGRPTRTFLNKISKGFGLVSPSYSHDWKVQRKFGLMTLRGFGMGKKSIENKITEEVKSFCNFLREQNGKAINISVPLCHSICNVICYVVLGKRFEYDDPDFQALLEGFVDVFKDPSHNAAFQLFSIAPPLAKIPPFSIACKRLETTMNLGIPPVQKIIKEHEETFDESHLRDFIDAFLMEMKNCSHPSFTNWQLVQYIRDLFSGGTDSSTTTLNWMFLILLHHPHAQKRIRSEIMDVFGATGQVEWKKRSEMHYTCAFIEESLRYRTIFPTAFPHSTTEEVVLGDYIIPKETMILTNIWAVHNDEEIWDKPKLFKPERFLNEKGEFERSRYVITFSIGLRHCLGEQLARMEIFIFFVNMLQSFEVLPDPETKSIPNIEDGYNGMFFLPKDYKVVLNQI